MPPLDVPPDLSVEQINDDIAGDKKGTATYSEFEEQAVNPLLNKYHVTPQAKPALAGEGEKRHIIVPSSYAVTWQRLLDFWAQKGQAIKRQDPRIGLMDTVPDYDGYAYRIRVERGEVAKQSLVYLGAAQGEQNSQKNETMIRQIADYLGVIQQQEQAQLAEQAATARPEPAIKAHMIDEGQHKALFVEKDFDDVWRRVGRILDSKGFTVEDRDRSQGTYFVHYLDPDAAKKQEDEGILDKLAFWRDDADKKPDEYYTIKLISDAVNTKIVILNAKGERISTGTAARLLTILKEQLVR